METIRNGGSFQGGNAVVGSEDSTGVMSLKRRVAQAIGMIRMRTNVLRNVWQHLGTGVHSFARISKRGTFDALPNTGLYLHSQVTGNQLPPQPCAVRLRPRCER